MYPHEDSDSDADMITMTPPRWQRWRPRRPVAIAGVAIVALAGGAGVGYAATQLLATGSTAQTAVLSAASPSAASAPAGAGPLGLIGLAAGVLHGQFTVPRSGGGYQTVDVQDGTVTAVSPGSVTVKSADGFTASYTVTSKTLVDARAAGIGAVHKGDTIVVTATVSGSTPAAASIVDLTEVKAGRASFGFRVRVSLPVRPTAPAQPPSA